MNPDRGVVSNGTKGFEWVEEVGNDWVRSNVRPWLTAVSQSIIPTPLLHPSLVHWMRNPYTHPSALFSLRSEAHVGYLRGYHVVDRNVPLWRVVKLKVVVTV